MILNHRSFHAMYADPPNFEAGIEFSNSAIEMAHQNDLRYDILLSSLTNRAVCETKLGLLDQALQTDLEGYQLAKGMNDQMWIAELLVNLAHDYHDLGDRIRAREHLCKALDLAQQNGYEKLITDINDVALKQNYTLVK